MYSSAPAAITKYPRLDGLNHRNSFLKFWKLESARSRCQQNSFHSEASSLGLLAAAVFMCVHITFSLCSWKEKESCYYKDVNPIISGLLPHLTLITSLETLFPNTATLGELEFQSMNLRKGWAETQVHYISSTIIVGLQYPTIKNKYNEGHMVNKEM